MASEPNFHKIENNPLNMTFEGNFLKFISKPEHAMTRKPNMFNLKT